MPLPLSLGISATDVSQDDNGGAGRGVGVLGGLRTKNASCSEPGDLTVGGAGWLNMCWEFSNLLVEL